jgi:hypothetical protein
MKEFEKDTGTIKPNETGTSVRGPVKLFAKDTGTVKPNETDTSVKRPEKFS